MAGPSTSQREHTAAALRIKRVAGRIGAVIHGVNLCAALDDATTTAIRQALLDHKVIFIRGQQAMNDADMEAFTQRLGEPIAHPSAGAMQGSRFLTDLDADAGFAASIWHTDMTFVPAYPALAVLRAVELPEYGGDTMWANCAAAYEDLPAELKVLANSLHGLHTNDYDFADLFEQSRSQRLGKFMAAVRRRIFVTEHPVVRVHEETGERSLILGNSFFSRFVGYDVIQSARLLEVFQEYITRPENTVRWQWQLGDVAIWDNRATQHRAVADYGDQRRQMRRAAAHGTVPVGVDGFVSRAIDTASAA